MDGEKSKQRVAMIPQMLLESGLFKFCICLNLAATARASLMALPVSYYPKFLLFQVRILKADVMSIYALTECNYCLCQCDL